MSGIEVNVFSRIRAVIYGGKEEGDVAVNKPRLRS
jgi:hypothetical protein